MSRPIGTIKNTGSRKVDMSLTAYYGGRSIGKCIQLTAKQEDGSYGYVQLDMSDFLMLKRIFEKEYCNDSIEIDEESIEYYSK